MLNESLPLSCYTKRIIATFLLNTTRILHNSTQQFTDSDSFYEGSKGWRSTQGGLSTIQAMSTDANNMGGLFIRKIGGAAAATVHLQKLAPLLFHPHGAQWAAGHFRPLYWMAIFANVALAAFYACYADDMAAAGADGMAKFNLAVLAVESLVLVYYLFTQKQSSTRAPAIAMPEGKTPDSVTSRIVTRTVAVAGSVMSLVLLRDLFFPGFILDFIPRDDIYLEWTNAFMHSPPPGSEEMDDQGLEAVLFVGDKFASQFMALNMLILSAYKFMTAFGIKYGSDGSGSVKCKMIWKVQCAGDLFVLLLMRIFSAAALSASLDLRWHLMLMGYEAFILGK